MMRARFFAFLLAIVFALPAVAGAAFPSVVSRATSTKGTAGTTHTVTLPSSIVAGNWIQVVVGLTGTADDATQPAGWTENFAVGSGSLVCGGPANCVMYAFRKLANGSEGATVDFTTTSSRCSAHASLQISGADETTYNEGPSATTNGTASAVDTGTTTPTAGAKDYLWVPFGVAVGTTSWDNTDPAMSGYSNWNGVSTAGCTTGVGVATMERQLNTTAQDPGTFHDLASNWRTITFAINPDQTPASSARRRLLLSKREPFDPLRWFLRGGTATWASMQCAYTVP